MLLQQQITKGDDAWVDRPCHHHLKVVQSSKVLDIDDRVVNDKIDSIGAYDYDLDLEHNPKLAHLLFADRSTNKNIKWATDNYADRNGGRYNADREIEPSLVLGDNKDIIVPRAKKDKWIQKSRTQKNAEVFTPSWIVDKQVSAVLEDFNDLDLEPFIKTTWLEITCGEAPYMANRYDMETGETIALEDRKGFIDRKFQRLNAEVDASQYKRWWRLTQEIYKSSYGYEYQGDSLMLARINLLLTFIDNYIAVFGEAPSKYRQWKIAEIISWNVFQMDGLTYTVPYTDDLYAKIIDWTEDNEIEFRQLGESDRDEK